MKSKKDTSQEITISFTNNGDPDVGIPFVDETIVVKLVHGGWPVEDLTDLADELTRAICGVLDGHASFKLTKE